ncbi:hypothetical protein B0O99DRAFT_298924 [Bisporella sp. PMI_857]|nr:hypothetical protein B0O99DRAFT_298924 [Bisporella sp. PMI_857]
MPDTLYIIGHQPPLLILPFPLRQLSPTTVDPCHVSSMRFFFFLLVILFHCATLNLTHPHPFLKTPLLRLWCVWISIFLTTRRKVLHLRTIVLRA